MEKAIVAWTAPPVPPLSAEERSRSASKLASLSEELKLFCNRQPASWLPPVGEALLPLQPHPIVEPLKGFSSTGCSRGLNVRLRSSSLQFSRLALAGRPREPCSSSLASLARSRRQARKRACSRSSSLQFSRLALAGRSRELCSSSLNWEGASLPPRPSLQSSETASCLLLHWLWAPA